MVGKTGAMSGISFARTLPGLVFPDLAVLHEKNVNMTSEKTFVDWQKGPLVKSTRGSLIGTIRLS